MVTVSSGPREDCRLLVCEANPAATNQPTSGAVMSSGPSAINVIVWTCYDRGRVNREIPTYSRSAALLKRRFIPLASNHSTRGDLQYCFPEGQPCADEQRLRIHRTRFIARTGSTCPIPKAGIMGLVEKRCHRCGRMNAHAAHNSICTGCATRVRRDERVAKDTELTCPVCLHRKPVSSYYASRAARKDNSASGACSDCRAQIKKGERVKTNQDSALSPRRVTPKRARAGTLDGARRAHARGACRRLDFDAVASDTPAPAQTTEFNWVVPTDAPITAADVNAWMTMYDPSRQD